MAMLSGILVFPGCKKENNNPPEDTYDLITSQVIGPAGGTIISDNVIVLFPPNALTSSTTIELYSSSTKNPYGEEGNSDVFWIKGLPDPLINPIKLSVKYKGSLTDQSYVCFGKYVIATSGQDTVLSEKLVLATDSSGFLQAMIPSGPLNNLKSIQYQGRYGIPFWSLSSYWYYQTDHFLIHFPGRFKNTGSVEALADGLEGAYDMLYAMGFRYEARTSWPVEVTVKYLGEEIWGQTDRSFPWTANSGYIEINSFIMPDKPLTKITGAHEFFHIVQDLYNYDEKYNWLQEASSVWFEEKFDVNPDLFVSDARNGHELEPFEGLQAGAEDNATHHGYGCSAVIKYLVGQYGDEIMKKIWEDCRDHSSHPIEAIKQATDPYVIWWMNFMRDYTLGEVYGDMSVAQAVFNDKFTISSDQDVFRSFERAYPDLSGYVYIVEPKSTTFNNATSLKLNLTGEGRAMYALIKTGETVSVIGYSVDQIIVNDLKGLQSSNSTIYVLVTNYMNTSPGYTATSTIKLDLTVQNTGYAYIKYFASQTDTVTVCQTSGPANFLIDASCILNSANNDFRVTRDSVWFENDYKWMELYYPIPAAGEIHTLQVDLNLQNLRKNPASTINWDPYIYQVRVYISDKNGQNDYYFDGNGNYSFNLIYDLNNSWPFASVYVTCKDVLNQGYECNSMVFTIGLFFDN